MLGNKARLDVGGSIHLEGFQGGDNRALCRQVKNFLKVSQEFPSLERCELSQ